MIRRDTNLKYSPFLLQPAGKDYLWGGSRLRDEFSKQVDMTPLAETWECSTHPDGTSIVASGEFKEQMLSKVLKAHPEFLGEQLRMKFAVSTEPPNGNSDYNGELLVLIKLIDAKRDLSVQVHPDDTYARKYENGSLGKQKCGMW